VDIRPASNTSESVRRLWTEANAAANRFQTTCSDYSGAPCRGDLQGNVQSIRVVAEPLAGQNLSAGRPLTQEQIRNFALHLELVERVRTIRWLAVIVAATAAVSAYLSSGDIVGNFVSRDDAERERENGASEPWQSGFLWYSVVKTRSGASAVSVTGGNLVGYFRTAEHAEAESGGGSVWPEED
jgi:hypothetical protein